MSTDQYLRKRNQISSIGEVFLRFFLFDERKSNVSKLFFRSLWPDDFGDEQNEVDVILTIFYESLKRTFNTKSKIFLSTEKMKKNIEIAFVFIFSFLYWRLISHFATESIDYRCLYASLWIEFEVSHINTWLTLNHFKVNELGFFHWIYFSFLFLLIECDFFSFSTDGTILWIKRKTDNSLTTPFSKIEFQRDMLKTLLDKKIIDKKFNAPSYVVTL